MRLYHNGFTLVEIMVVVAIIGILAAVAIPGYGNMRTRARRSTCIANLKQIDGAIERWSFINAVTENVDLTPYKDGVYDFLHGGEPSCPSGSAYTLATLGQHPQVKCNVQGHELP